MLLPTGQMLPYVIQWSRDRWSRKTSCDGTRVTWEPWSSLHRLSLHVSQCVVGGVGTTIFPIPQDATCQAGSGDWCSVCVRNVLHRMGLTGSTPFHWATEWKEARILRRNHDRIHEGAFVGQESGDWLDRASRFLVMLEQLLCRFQIVSKSLESKTPPIWVFSLVIAIEGFCIRIPPTYIDRTMTNDCVKYQIRNHLSTEITTCSSMWLQRQISLLGLIIRSEPNNPVRQLLFEKGTLIPRLEFRKRPVKPRQQWLSTTYADGCLYQTLSQLRSFDMHNPAHRQVNRSSSPEQATWQTDTYKSSLVSFPIENRDFP